MARALWSGQLTFGLLSIPVQLVTAVREKPIRFHLLHDADNVRLETKRVCPQDGQEIPWEHVVKGHELSKGEYVVFTKEELKALEESPDRTIEIVDFVDLKEIDPVYYDATYHLAPGKGAAKPYRLLLRAMQETSRVALGRVTMRGRRYLVAIRPREDVLALETMHFADEVVPATEVADAVEKAAEPAARELQMATKIVETLTGPFEPEKYRDDHREKLLEAIEQKAEGREIVAQPEAPAPKKAPDLMAALEASLAEARRRVQTEG